MTDYAKALAVARKAHKLGDMGKCDRALGDLIAAIDAQKPVAWRVDRGDSYELFFREDAAKRRCQCFVQQRSPEPLYAAPPAAVQEGYVPVSVLIEAREEVESWAAYASPHFQEKHDLAGTLAKLDAQISAAQGVQHD